MLVISHSQKPTNYEWSMMTLRVWSSTMDVMLGSAPPEIPPEIISRLKLILNDMGQYCEAQIKKAGEDLHGEGNTGRHQGIAPDVQELADDGGSSVPDTEPAQPA